ncbi:MAG: oxidoreductase [Acidobacteria bacterium]|nr:oxidoreductase [Acidobacteriota bacterium]
MIARLVEFRDIGDEIRHFVFDAEADDFRFTPGQFVSLSDVVGDRKVTRAYSIASAPAGRRFELCLNRVKDGRMSPRLFELGPGDTIEMGAPLGYFTPRTPASDSVLVATGTGVAPFRSMLRARPAEWAERRFTLIFGVRYERNLLYREEFEAMAAERPNFRFWPVLSRPEEGWTGRSGHVQAHLDEAIGGRLDMDVYVCGLKLMVDDVRARLKERGFDRKRVIYEKYD